MRGSEGPQAPQTQATVTQWWIKVQTDPGQPPPFNDPAGLSWPPEYIMLAVEQTEGGACKMQKVRARERPDPPPPQA